MLLRLSSDIDVESYIVVAGIPAKKVSDRPRYLQYDFDG